jgi:hypothetical protein
VQNEPGSVVAGLFIESLNDVLALHAKWVQATLRSRIPWVIWATLYFVASLAMPGIGYHEGLTSLRRSPVLVIVVLTFSAVIYLIADVDRPQEGPFNVNQQAIVDFAICSMRPVDELASSEDLHHLAAPSSIAAIMLSLITRGVPRNCRLV